MLAVDSTTTTDERNLKLDSTLQELPVWTVQMESDNPGGELAKLFEQDPLLPGIILTKNHQCLGMISRGLFFEQMSQPYGLALFARRPIEYFYNSLQPQTLVLPQNQPIVEATQMALGRSPELVYEPILVTDQSSGYGILDFHQLLLAYSQIYVLTLTRLQKEKERARIARADYRDLQHNYTRLLQNEKMIALGQLVAGIAHEINNPMNFIYGNLNYAIQYVEEIMYMLKCYQQNQTYSEMLLQAKNQGIEIDFIMEDLPKLLSSMMVGATRINEIVLSLRNFSRLDEAEIKSVNIHEGIDNTLIILQNNLKAKPDRPEINLIKEYGDLPLVECYAGQMNQVFMNIIANAIDALSESYNVWKANGNLSSSIQKPLTICIRTELDSHNQAVIRIADNGMGIPEEIQKRLFDPFFTTKPVGKGTGLGLSISYQIIEKHCGQISCISKVGEGCEFVVKIPIIFENAAQKIVS
ncbi:ATP-binding protein [Cronbergia sp. UHCC 0137]|uniref:sensor histidine kinase n=1 Tax=Cronbergia sp. UHCC 0137 TaxID=3110239 RepID=UPI002B1F9E80|nr:ATP-binding protein [Cronbergia sp. UHCC 0137]MEA5617686.1 ATP-binding protein [Cronbergia sp. UHCC 0137]